MRNSITYFKHSIAASVIIAGLTTSSFAQILRTVALSGDVVPGDSSAVFRTFSIPVLNRSGEATFDASLNREDEPLRSRGIWSEQSGGLVLVAQSGDSAPGVEDAVFLSFGWPEFQQTPLFFGESVQSNGGSTAFYSALFGSGAFGGSKSIWSITPNSELALVARGGNEASGTQGRLFSEFKLPVLNSRGQTAFVASLAHASSTPEDLGIWSEGGKGDLRLVALENTPAPGTGGALFNFLSDPVLNSAGQTAFRGAVDAASLTSRGIWSEGGGEELKLVARAGEDVPSDTNTHFFLFRDPTINNVGDIAFQANLISDEGPSSGNVGIFAERGGNDLAFAARGGEPAPDADGAQFRFFNDPVLNSAGSLAFVGFLSGDGITSTNDSGVWSEGGGNGLQLVALEGTAAPGASGALFSSFVNSVFPSEAPILNGMGRTAFLGTLTGPDVNEDNEKGIWAEDVQGNLTLIIREGDRIDVNDDPLIDDFRTVEKLFLSRGSGNEDGRRSGFNDRGQLAFSARFTDDSRGVFVSNLVAVPEPSSILMLIAFTVTTMGRNARNAVSA